ncbi:glutamine--fructose-6-phosphate transaminase (isomerizing) [Burkholderia gladioli]|jgi:glucosamine--fructose-6-phosphate aminotransferase (isomerizing)|uniref:Glutamine--fructose-6-phosphate aminotransferase [isomerizing] n=1 Tax=Burkholderia gladioli TaxID=28095 RepID=A0AAW3FBV2_BURGA|nr:glutamine--fructose-6-phosphate transaminase (isomerizing) [Burkholderia gladioli]AJW97590.1 glutamine-fructose-6-phosphate transaminase [Burkholderia gladioli]ASD81037.1 glutamine--fructose-6-phosphate aminotransferase [Burkholderia gladioli pv. gladioli]AWY53730.1 glutamine--fructose-6-phosphate aminotransferase [Burkholderia gladioli pv. gladioli]KGC17992.1 glutamine-fructose-6-phosphate transaminase [Burkholderia gladioli]KKJ02775.1 glucosamine--fructose-6-phosphate aminotransferase [Bu
MCGIVGAVAQRNIVPVLIEGLRRLEYRGYDSCGVAVLENGAPKRARSVARVADLDAQVRETQLEGVTGISHTRWATHGAPVTHNAHPIFSSDAVALVHNGIIENYEALREGLRAKGYEFVTQTDTEVIAHLVHSLYRGDLFAAVREAVAQLHGAYAIAVIHKDQPNTVVGARQGSPLVVGFGEGENFLASDALALAGSTDRYTFLEEGDVCELSLDGVKIVDRNGARAEREIRVVSAYGGAVELGPYRHFMQKEIFEQPRAIGDTIPPVEAFEPSLFGDDAAATFKEIDSLLILACGTSYYSGMTAKYWLESIAKIPTQVEIASEYRYRDSVPNPRALVVVISQSGETADTLAALKHAQTLGHKHTLAVCNVATSAMVRQTALQFLTRAGTEIGVASTKAFTTQLVALFLLAATLGKVRGHVDATREADYIRQLRHLPAALNSVLALEPQIIAWSEEFSRKENALFLGRGLHYPIALEGALKLKEISYIHAEAYPAGELKHGPLALVTEAMPVVTVAPNDTLLEKLKSNMQEVRARGGELYVFADADTHIVNDDGLHVIRMPEHYGPLSPILHVVPLQLLAYHTACARGTDVDKPRNLAKSVTVE